MRSRTHIHLLAAGALALSASVLGCARDNDADVDSAAVARGTIDTAATALRVTDVNLGRRVGADNRITDGTDDFNPRDTIYASVETSGTASGATITARWTFQDGQVVDESSKTISPSGNAVTEFHIMKPGGWPVGRYRVAILVNGTQVEDEEFEVKR